MSGIDRYRRGSRRDSSKAINKIGRGCIGAPGGLAVTVPAEARCSRSNRSVGWGVGRGYRGEMQVDSQVCVKSLRCRANGVEVNRSRAQKGQHRCCNREKVNSGRGMTLVDKGVLLWQVWTAIEQ